ncbi:hypothetical protein G9F72_007995 [Clostridium estertheticum]|uniref:hypothetical protein n=1 Tax=Clostridium estertheticum TaxID=238834 RepID=UPI001CD11829|nr:hypothetical protein [Clostridium estertheticum]MBZ9686269.1 hypothetical protein [Clostridium estertheticum]
MFIVPPNNFNGTPMWNPYPMFSEPPMMPMSDFDMLDDTRQNPIPQPPPSNQDFQIPPVSPIINNPLYNQGWLTKQIGKYVKVAFLLGTNLYQDRTGILQEVGISFIVLKETSTNDLIMCDIYSIKFVTVYSNQDLKCQS